MPEPDLNVLLFLLGAVFVREWDKDAHAFGMGRRPALLPGPRETRSSRRRGGYRDQGDQPPSTARAIMSTPTVASTMPALLLPGVSSASCCLLVGFSKE